MPTEQHQPPATASAMPDEDRAAAEAAPPATAPGANWRAVDDGIAAGISTRAGPVTVVFTGRNQGRASPAAGAYTYRGRQYTGTVLVTGPAWTGTALTFSLLPAGNPAGTSTAGTIAAVIAADIAAWLSDHPEILDQAAQARERVGQARARRDLTILDPEIRAARQHLAELLRKRDQLAATAAGGRSDPPGSIWDYGRLDPVAAARFVVEAAQLRMDGEGPGPDGGDTPWVMENDDAFDTVHALIGQARGLLGWEAGEPPLDSGDYRKIPDEP